MVSIFDGQICNKCQIWKPFTDFPKRNDTPLGYRRYCKVCDRPRRKRANDQARDYRRAWYRDRLDQQRAYHRAYWAKHRDRLLAHNRAYYAATAEQRRAQKREYERAHKDQIRAYKQRHRDHAKAMSRAWFAARPGLRGFYVRRYHLRKRGAGGTHTLAEWQALCAHFGNVCLCCGAAGALTEDHVIPISRGGTDAIDNLQPLCRSCNSQKHATIVDYRDPVRLRAFLADRAGVDQ